MRYDHVTQWVGGCRRYIVGYHDEIFIPLQLNSIYEGKLPVSRAKMASITRSAVKSLKVKISVV